jgi:DNA-binding winged helix-turn-helix (wHTH) protein
VREVLDFLRHPKRHYGAPAARLRPAIRNLQVSLHSGEVRKAGLSTRVQQPMKLLEILLERPGEVATREELRSRV